MTIFVPVVFGTGVVLTGISRAVGSTAVPEISKIRYGEFGGGVYSTFAISISSSFAGFVRERVESKQSRCHKCFGGTGGFEGKF